METTSIINLENDGLNMSVDDRFLYVRCKRDMIKYNLSDMKISSQNTIFKKDGKSRGFTICDEFICLYDFCDLYILKKDDLQIVEVIRIGVDLSSDLGAIRFGSRKAYVCIRNGKIAVVDIDTKDINKYEISDSTFWDYCIFENRIYAGTVQGELIEVDCTDMQVLRKTELGKKNIYSVIINNGIIYTVSQDMTIKAIDAASFETVCIAKKAVKGMVKVLGVHKENLVVADRQISLWDAQTLQLRERISFPAHWNSGVIINGNTLYGSDNQNIYRGILS